MKTSIRFFAILVGITIVIGLLSSAIACHYGPQDSTVSIRWSNFWTVFGNVVLLVTFLVIAYYTYETNLLRKATIDGNALSFRPILVFKADAKFCTVTNKENGPALNVCLIIWDGKKLKVTSDSTVPGIMTPGDSYLFDSHVDIDSVGFKQKLPGFTSLTDRISKTAHALFCLTYRDLAGNRFYSIINGSNETNYEGVFEHGPIPGT